MTTPFIVIILVNWNGKADTLECLASLEADTYPNKQILVVDNGSRDDSAHVLRAQFPAVTVIETGANLGFTGGNNVGIRYALAHGADYVFLLNNDTTVEPDALTLLVNTAQKQAEYGVLTPVIHYYDNADEAWFAGSSLDLRRGVAVHDNSRVPARDEPPYRIPWASGCAMLIRSDLLWQAGGFDNRYFLNWEDVDLCLRVRALGSEIGLVPAARILHKVSRSFASVSYIGRYYHVRNNLLLVSLHGGRESGHARRAIILSRLRESVSSIAQGRIDQGTNLGVTLRAVGHHYLGRYGPLCPVQKHE